jgi:hypothetical protein
MQKILHIYTFFLNPYQKGAVMLKQFKIYLFLLFFIKNLNSLTVHETILIDHVKQSIDNAKNEISKITPAMINLQGYSSAKVRHLLNNICSLDQASYLEIGVWQGSTFIASLYNNENNLKEAVAIDDWSEFGGPYQQFNKNCATFLSNNHYKFYNQDCFAIDINKLFKSPVNIYFYDGNHTQESQEKAFTYYDSLFDEVFIAIIDDWNWIEVKKGTEAAFEKLNYTILFEEVLPAQFNGDKKLWWNGIYIAVIKRNT